MSDPGIGVTYDFNYDFNEVAASAPAEADRSQNNDKKKVAGGDALSGEERTKRNLKRLDKILAKKKRRVGV